MKRYVPSIISLLVILTGMLIRWLGAPASYYYFMLIAGLTALSVSLVILLLRYLRKKNGT